MNKALKLLVKIGLGCCLVGTLLCLVGWVGGADIGAAINSDALDIEWDDDHVDVDTRFMEDLYTNKATEAWPLEEFENISAELGVSELIICGSDEFSMTYTDSKYDLDKNHIKYKIENGTLYLEEEEDDYWGVQADSLRKIEIHIPKDHKLGEVEIDQGVGKLTIRSLTMKELDIDNGVGDTDLNGLAIDSLSVENGVGNIRGYGLDVMKETEISNEVGDTELMGAFLGKTYLKNGVGNLELSLRPSRKDYYLNVEGDVSGKLHTYTTGSYDPDIKIWGDEDAPNHLTIVNGAGEIHLK